jgi:hypothetical protein
MGIMKCKLRKASYAKFQLNLVWTGSSGPEIDAQCRAFVNTVIILRLCIMLKICGLAERLLDSNEKLGPTELFSSNIKKLKYRKFYSVRFSLSSGNYFSSLNVKNWHNLHNYVYRNRCEY